MRAHARYPSLAARPIRDSHSPDALGTLESLWLRELIWAEQARPCGHLADAARTHVCWQRLGLLEVLAAGRAPGCADVLHLVLEVESLP